MCANTQAMVNASTADWFPYFEAKRLKNCISHSPNVVCPMDAGDDPAEQAATLSIFRFGAKLDKFRGANRPQARCLERPGEGAKRHRAKEGKDHK